MKLNTLKRAPIVIASMVIGLVCLLQILRPDTVERLERMTFDFRVREALKHSPLVATNLGFVSISDDTIKDLDMSFVDNRPYGLYWPRHIYGRVADELRVQGAKAVAFDILLSDLRPDHFPVALQGMQEIDSDEYFAQKIRQAGNVIIAAEQGTIPPALFRTNALALGDITDDRDTDGIHRRAKAFRTYLRWHSAFRAVESDPDYGVDLGKAVIATNQITLPQAGGLGSIKIPLDTNGNFDLAGFVGDQIPKGMKRFDKPFSEERVWNMGIVLAAQELKLDLAHAEVELDKGRITLRGDKGVERVIPVDREGFFYINWSLTSSDDNLTREPFEGLLAQYQQRNGHTNAVVNLLASRWVAKQVDLRGKLVMVGSSAIGNDLTDLGATPMGERTLLVSRHWNVANSLLTNQFITTSSLPVELLLIVAMGALSGALTWFFRSHASTVWVLLAVVAYWFGASFVFVHYRYWIPVVMPSGVSVLVLHSSLLAYVVVVEQKERRRVKSVFSRVVSPAVVNELLKTDMRSLGGARANVTVLFADIRGFTDMTDQNRDRAAEYVKTHNLTGAAAEEIFERHARETLDTVNAYLKVIADTVLKHDGTIDKFIGDCVMAFWGAPIPNQRHAATCVRAAIEVQRAVYRLNRERQAENERLELENIQLTANGQETKPLLKILSIGSGVNTGVVTVGLMGSDEQGNYTVFGRDVNLASRLESLSGRGRILISEATLAEIIQDDSALALSCVELPPVKVKGIRDAVPIFEVPWREAGYVVLETEAAHPMAGEGDTGYLRGSS